MPFINCEVYVILNLSENCVFTNIIAQAVVAAHGNNPARPEINAPTNATFKITDTKLYVAVVTFSAQDKNKFLEQLRIGLKRTIKWNWCGSEMTNQTKNDNFSYLIDPTFIKVNRLFVLSFENENDRTTFSKYFVSNAQIKDFNVLIDGKSFSDTPIKNDEETYEQIIEMGRNND